MAAKQGYLTLLLASERDRDSEAKELAMMMSRNIAGILIVPSSPDSIGQLQDARARGVPVVMMDRTFPGLDAGAVMVENEQGARKAVNHLLEHGHENILCLGYDSQFNSIGLRIDGYRKAMTQAGFKPDIFIAEDVSGVAPKLLKRLRSSKPPTALFTLNNVTTMDVLQTLQRVGIQVPHKLAIIGFDDFEMAALLSVPLTAVRQPATELGRTATHLLLGLDSFAESGKTAGESSDRSAHRAHNPALLRLRDHPPEPRLVFSVGTFAGQLISCCLVTFSKLLLRTFF